MAPRVRWLLPTSRQRALLSAADGGGRRHSKTKDGQLGTHSQNLKPDFSSNYLLFSILFFLRRVVSWSRARAAAPAFHHAAGQVVDAQAFRFAYFTYTIYLKPSTQELHSSYASEVAPCTRRETCTTRLQAGQEHEDTSHIGAAAYLLLQP